MELTTKLQHKYYETGEFCDIKSRSFEEISEIIKAFPWDAERPLTDIQLTGPSVTIENKIGEFLKLGLYFNGKFCLYFYNSEHQLFELIEPVLADALTIIKSFYDGTLATESFTKHLINFNNKKHFKTNYFEYTVNGYRLLLFAGLPIGAITLYMTFIAVTSKFHDDSIFMAFEMLAFIGMLTISILVLNYYNHDKNLCLQMSKGQDIFKFGFKNSMQSYDKKNIVAINYKTPRRRGRDSDIAVFEIVMKNDEKLVFSNLLIARGIFFNKFQKIEICRIDDWLPMFG